MNTQTSEPVQDTRKPVDHRPRRGDKLNGDRLPHLASDWSRQFQETRSRMTGPELGFNSHRKHHAQMELGHLKKLDPRPDALAVYNIDLTFHQFMAQAGDSGLMVSKAKSLISHLMAFVGMVADKDPAVLYKINSTSEMPDGYHQVRDKNEDLLSELSDTQLRLEEQTRGLATVNARLQQLEGEKLAVEQELLALRNNKPVDAAAPEKLKQAYIDLNTVMERYSDYFSGTQAFSLDETGHVLGALSAVTEELERIIDLPAEELDAVKLECHAAAQKMMNNMPAVEVAA